MCVRVFTYSGPCLCKLFAYIIAINLVSLVSFVLSDVVLIPLIILIVIKPGSICRNHNRAGLKNPFPYLYQLREELIAPCSCSNQCCDGFFTSKGHYPNLAEK